ncbi:MAG: HAD family hydrolase [Methanolobus sp.]
MKDKLLILDLDETLIHSEMNGLGHQHDFRCSDYYVYKRPFLEEFLEFIASLFEVAVWTSASSDYADCIISNIFPENYPLKFVWSRERCTRMYVHPSETIEMNSFTYVKDMKKVKNKGYDLRKILVIDDSPEQLQRSYGNLIQVKQFSGEEDDNELYFLKSYLAILKNVMT